MSTQIFDTAAAFARARPSLPGGVVGIVLAATPRHAQTSAARLIEQGCTSIIVLGEAGAIEADGAALVHIAERPGHHAWATLSTVLRGLKGRWVVWLWAGEYLFFPFGDTRSLPELCGFLADERRRALYCYALDLYAPEMPGPGEDPAGVQLWFDRIGYQPFPKPDKGLDLYGGLSWRFEQFAPAERAQIGRSALVKVREGLRLNRRWRFEDKEYDSVSCPWHHSPTGAIMTLERSYRIMAHPGFRDVAGDLIWFGSEPFDWSSRQLLELGMIEPGQWF